MINQIILISLNRLNRDYVPSLILLKECVIILFNVVSTFSDVAIYLCGTDKKKSFAIPDVSKMEVQNR